MGTLSDGFDLVDCELAKSIHGWCVSLNLAMVFAPSVTARISDSLISIRPSAVPFVWPVATTVFVD